jgi:hypothetical protein
MKVSNELKTKIATSISTGNTVEGFDLLIQLGFRDAILLKANYLAAKKEYNGGRASFDEYSRKVAMTHQGMLALCNAEAAPDMDAVVVYKNAEKAKPQKKEDILRNGALHNPAFMLAHYGKALRLTHADLAVKLHEKYMELMEESAQVAFGFKVPTEPVLDEELLELVKTADDELRALKNDWKENVRQLVSTKSFPSPANIAKALETCQANGLLTDLKFHVELSGWAIQAQILQQITTAIQ